MLVKDQIIYMKWHYMNKEYYENKGYKFTKYGDEFFVKAEDLSIGSQSVVKVQCDYCGKVQEKRFSTYLRQHHDKFGDCCKDCSSLKIADIMTEQYGVPNASLVKEFQDKRKRTFIENYGFENPSQSEEIKKKKEKTSLNNYGVTNPMKAKNVQEKAQKTCLKKYGVKYSTQTEIMKEKSKETCIERYGVDNASKSEDIKKKIEDTWMEKYGVKNIMELEYFRNKILKSFTKNGTSPTSSMQIQISNIIKDVYGEDNVKDNVPCGSCLLDVELNYNNYLIDIEYDGMYWHKGKEERDRRRNYYVIKKGYKVLRIRSNNELPTKEQIIKAVDYLVEDNHSLYYIDLDI